MQTCKTCKSWENGNEGYNGNRCLSEKMIGDASDEFEDGCSNSEGLGDTFTGPDFGCIHHEPVAVVTGGSFTLSDGNTTCGPFAHDDSSQDVQAAIDAMQNVTRPTSDGQATFETHFDPSPETSKPFMLTLNGHTIGPFTPDTTRANVLAMLSKLPDFGGPFTVTGDKGGPFTITQSSVDPDCSVRAAVNSKPTEGENHD